MSPGQTVPATREDVDRLTQRLQEQGSAFSAVQVDVRHIAGSVDRAFVQMREDKAALTHAMESLLESLRTDREEARANREAVVEFRSAMRTLKYAWSGVFFLLLVMAGMYSSGNEKDKTRTDADVGQLRADVDRRKLAVDLRLDTLSQQVQEVRLEQQRQEAKRQ